MDLLIDLPDAADNAETFNRVMLILTERADDATFLRRVLILPADQSQALTTNTAITVANRLASLGFSRQVLTLAKRPQDSDRRRERARLRAKAALLNQRPHQAMLELADDPSEDASSLRAEALQAAGDFAAAGDLMRKSGHKEEAERLFWHANLPEQSVADTQAKFGRVAR